jgi:CheY-like chemotaxis protein
MFSRNDRVTRKSALVLSTSRLTRIVVTDLLRDFGGYTPVAVDSVSSVVRMARQDNPALFLLDSSDTMLTGAELVRMIRSDDQISPDAKVICLLPGARRVDVEAIREAGGDAVLSIPVVPQRLFRILSRFVMLPQAA